MYRKIVNAVHVILGRSRVVWHAFVRDVYVHTSRVVLSRFRDLLAIVLKILPIDRKLMHAGANKSIYNRVH